MINFKLIAFDVRDIREDKTSLPTLADLAERSRSGETISVEDLRKAGVPVAVPLLNRKSESGELKGLVEKLVPLPPKSLYSDTLSRAASSIEANTASPILSERDLIRVVNTLNGLGPVVQVTLINEIVDGNGLKDRERVFAEIVIGLIKFNQLDLRTSGEFAVRFENLFGNDFEKIGTFLARITNELRFDATCSGIFAGRFGGRCRGGIDDLDRLAVSFSKSKKYGEVDAAVFVTCFSTECGELLGEGLRFAANLAVLMGYNEGQLQIFAKKVANVKGYSLDAFCPILLQRFREIKSKIGLDFPPMLEVQGQTFKRIMIGELTDREAVQFLKPEEIQSGNNIVPLRDQLENPKGISLTIVNLDDEKRIIALMNSRGRKFRGMDLREFLDLPDNIKAQLKGENWFLVETARGSGQFNRVSLSGGNQTNCSPEDRYFNYAIRLVED